MLRKGKGLTLVEIIVALAVFAIVVASLLPAFIFVARLNVVSKSGVDATAVAQLEAERFYAYSRNYTYAETLALTEVTNDYAIVTVDAVTTLTRSDAEVEVTITMTNNSPAAGMVEFNVLVELMNNTQNALPEQVDTILLFMLT